MDVNKILGAVTSSGLSKGLLGGAAGGLLAGSLMTKKGRKTAKTVAKVGGVAALGALAWKAYSSYRDNQAASSDAVASGVGIAASSGAKLQTDQGQQFIEHETFDNLDQIDSVGSDAFVVVQAMVAAAMADGHIDGGEQQRIFEQVNALELDADDKAALFDEMRQARSAQSVASLVSHQALAVEVYLASVLAVDESASAAQTYLSDLRSALNLPPALAGAVQEQAVELQA